MQPPISAFPPLKVIFFDAAGTLIGLVRSVEDHYCEAAGRHGLGIDRQAMREAFRLTWKEMPVPVSTRAPRPDDDRGWWRELVDRVLDRCGVDRAGGFDREAYFAELYEIFAQPGVWALFPEVAGVLARLATTYRLGIISNFDRRLRQVLADLGLDQLFSPIVISSEVGADKPDPWIFQQALAAAGVEPPEALHVGDEPGADWEGAAAVGMRVFRLQRPENTLEALLELLPGATLAPV